MSDPDSYPALHDGPEVELKVKGSVFLARALYVADEDEVALRLDAIRRRAHDATHHCWAARLGRPGAARERSDDDGEPAGTAGPPILSCLQAAELYRALVVVVRWFGGTRLGTGGLARAYGEAARLALEPARRRRIFREMLLEVEVAYEDVGAVEAVLAREADALRGIEREFLESARLRVRAMCGRGEAIRAALVEATAARASVSVAGEREVVG